MSKINTSNDSKGSKKKNEVWILEKIRNITIWMEF